MVPYGIIAGQLIRAANNAHERKKHAELAAIVEDVYLSILKNKPALPPKEIAWIFNNKIKLEIQNMTNVELSNIINQQYENIKQSEKGQPTRYVLLKESLIEEFHNDYLAYVNTCSQQELHKKYIAQNGASDQEIIQNFFEE